MARAPEALVAVTTMTVIWRDSVVLLSHQRTDGSLSIATELPPPVAHALVGTMNRVLQVLDAWPSAAPGP